MPKPETLERMRSKARILRIARKGGDWKVAADTLEINYKTAWMWVSEERKSDLQESAAPPKHSWGGKRAEKITDEHVAFLERLLGDNCFASLREMVEALQREFGLRVVAQTVHKRLRGAVYTLRRAAPDAPLSLSPEQAAGVRREFAVALARVTAAGKRVFFADETNFNLWCARRLERCRNVHVLVLLSADGAAHWEHTSGALHAADMAGFVGRALDTLAATHAVALADVALVVGGGESGALVPAVLAADPRFRGVTLLQLPAASPALHACAGVFERFRASVRQFLRCHQEELYSAPPEGKTVIEHRSAFLARAAEELFPLAATRDECAKSVALACGAAQDLLEGDGGEAQAPAQPAGPL
ncbi:hypothetical protein PybrP1_003009 [[Pythium] brassicae (nom. inval.)]|nr:hypothetical protein PybrP1_003009 [[Pythium] brassicae (nom. inval.)]